MENQIQDALVKIVQGEYRRQIDSLQDLWIHKSPLEASTGRLTIRKLCDMNRASPHDEHLVDFEKLKKVELQNDNLAKFMDDWGCCLRRTSCRFAEDFTRNSYGLGLKTATTLRRCSRT